MSDRRMPTLKKIAAAWDRCDKSCWACGDGFDLQRCHIVSRQNGGSDEPDNLAILCRPCHAKSEHFNRETFFRWLSQCEERGIKHYIIHVMDRVLLCDVSFEQLEKIYNEGGVDAAVSEIINSLYYAQRLSAP